MSLRPTASASTSTPTDTAPTVCVTPNVNVGTSTAPSHPKRASPGRRRVERELRDETNKSNELERKVEDLKEADYRYYYAYLECVCIRATNANKLIRKVQNEAKKGEGELGRLIRGEGMLTKFGKMVAREVEEYALPQLQRAERKINSLSKKVETLTKTGKRKEERLEHMRNLRNNHAAQKRNIKKKLKRNLKKKLDYERKKKEGPLCKKHKPGPLCKLPLAMQLQIENYKMDTVKVMEQVDEAKEEMKSEGMLSLLSVQKRGTLPTQER